MWFGGSWVDELQATYVNVIENICDNIKTYNDNPNAVPSTIVTSATFFFMMLILKTLSIAYRELTRGPWTRSYACKQ